MINLKKILFTTILISVCSLSALSATYKVNSNGTMTGPAGTTQKVAKPSSGGGQPKQPLYNTVQSGTYTSNVKRYVGQPDIVEIIMDYSGSMSSWVSEANRTMSSILAQIPTTIKVGMRVTGYQSISYPLNTTSVSQTIKSGVHKVAAATTSQPIGGYCRATQQLIPIGDSTTNANAILNSVTLGGSTPLVYALSQTVQKDFAPYGKSLKKKIILITDGGENCSANPCAYAATLAATRPDIVVDVVLVGGSSGSQFRCFSELTGGTLYTPSQVYNFGNVILNSATNNNVPAQNTQTVQQNKSNVQNYEYVEE